MTENIKNEIENSVIDCINFGVAGRLIIFKPEKSIFEADLAIGIRSKYKEEEIYFQINSIVGYIKDGIFIKDILQKNLKTSKNFYLIFLQYDEIRQKISDYIWLLPSAQFKDMAKVVKIKTNNLPEENFLRFEAPLDIKKKNQYSKFLIKNQELGKTILSALEKGGRFIFKEINFEESQQINLENLKDFLCDARANTYASNNPGIDNPRLLESKQLEFQKGEYFYRDIYFIGKKNLVGQEIIYYNSKPIWGMNYVGNDIGKLETKFLKESLLKLVDKCRTGESCEYQKREFKYKDQGQGNIEKFFGTEEIFLNNKNVYKLNYEGRLL